MHSGSMALSIRFHYYDITFGNCVVSANIVTMNGDSQTHRTDFFMALKEHAWLLKSFARLSAKEVSICLTFIVENDHLDKGEFEMKINRMFLDKIEKPKHWKEMSELLTCANSALPAPPVIT